MMDRINLKMKNKKSKYKNSHFNYRRESKNLSNQNQKRMY